MLTVIEGVYENGQIILDHSPKTDTKTRVVGIFEKTAKIENVPQKRPSDIA